MFECSFSTMMPGENRTGTGTGGVASEASCGTCHNCTVLNQSLDEYVAALLTLKQKIIDTDLLLSEYKEKCDELQKSQRESAKLHAELDAVLLKLGPLEKQTVEYEAVRAELEETTAALKAFQVKSDEAETLREEKAKALAANAKLEEDLKKAEDAANARHLEASNLRSEKKVLQSDLQKTQESLRSSRQAVEELENVKLQNAKTLILKSNLENQLLALEDTKLEQNQTIQDLRSKNLSLETNITLIEEKLTKLEKELNKETRCSSTQTENEPKVDKAKVWSLLQEVWNCVNPLSKTPENLHFHDNPPSSSRPPRSPPPPPPDPLPVSPFRNSVPESRLATPKRTKASPGNAESPGGSAPRKAQKKRRICGKKKRSSESEEFGSKSDEVWDLSLNPADRSCGNINDVWDLLGLSSPLPPLLSPLPPDDLEEMEVDSGLKEVSGSKDGDDGDDDGKFSNPEPSQDRVGVSSDFLKAPETDEKILFPDIPQIINSEDPPTAAVESPPEEPDVKIRVDRIRDSQDESRILNARDEEPDEDRNDEIGHGSDPVEKVLITVEDEALQPGGPAHDLLSSPHAYSRTEPEGTVEELRAEDDKINGRTCGDSSDDEEGEVEGTCSGTASDSIKLQEVQGTNCESKEKNVHPENKEEDGGGGRLMLGSMEGDVSRPVNSEDTPRGDVKEDSGPANQVEDESENIEERNQQDEPPGSSSPKPEEPSGESEDTRPVTSVRTSPQSSFDTDAAATSVLSPESLGKVLTEMGPPLPPVVLPLTATPPKPRKLLHRPSIQLPTWSSTEGPFSLKQQSKVPSPDPEASLTAPSPSNGVPSSPLQFGSATPKHALPVPGRLPSSALSSSSPSASQENSMQMLDTMYPELSAQARTLNILRGNVSLGRSESGTSPPSVNPISGNKTINSSSTAFTKTEQTAKRTGANVLLPKSAKRLRLDTCSPDPAGLAPPPPPTARHKTAEGGARTNGASREAEIADDPRALVSAAFKKLRDAYFDVLPVIRSHVFLGRISDVPVLRDEEKAVIADFCSEQSLAEDLMSAILSEIKAERDLARNEIVQSHCRVYAGLCRWRGDWQKAHSLVYTLLKEDFPEAPKLILFMVTTWPTLLSHAGPLCRAVNVAIRLKADGEVLDYLTKYLHWDERPPADVHDMIDTLIKSLLADATLTFRKHARYGHDLCPAAWEYIFSLELLCAHLGWKWTHDHIIGKRLWPVMNAWVTQPRPQQTPVRDVCVAAVLRLIGRLGQLGLKEKLRTSVQNVAKAINLFGKHGISEGVPWEVQLCAVYAIYDLAPSDPKQALEALASWREQITETVPSAVTSCITQIGSICRHVKPANE